MIKKKSIKNYKLHLLIVVFCWFGAEACNYYIDTLQNANEMMHPSSSASKQASSPGQKPQAGVATVTPSVVASDNKNKATNNCSNSKCGKVDALFGGVKDVSKLNKAFQGEINNVGVAE